MEPRFSEVSGGEPVTLEQILDQATPEQARQVTINIHYCENLTMSDASTVQTTTVINTHDPDLLNTFREVICHSRVDGALLSLLVDLHNEVGKLEKEQSDCNKSKPILERIAARFKQVKELGDNVKGALPYLTVVYKMVRPLAAACGINLPDF